MTFAVVFTLLGLSIISFHPSKAEKTGRPETPVAEDFENEGIEGLSFFGGNTYFSFGEKMQIYFCFLLFLFFFITTKHTKFVVLRESKSRFLHRQYTSADGFS